ncbi:MAG TPA: Fis family transcriptional regulator, partial [candidate division Zixibacteria bacterium]|nr:Fis family transcriptional regulator [candidate division Zixibacteria bacterium]
VITVELPPLRARKEDIPLLVHHFINRFNNLKDRLITEVSPDVMAVLMNYDYPGNIRELENIIEHAFVLSKGTVINLECLPDSIRPKDKSTEIVSHSLEEMEAAYLKEALRKNNWNRTKTAAQLGIHKTTLWRKMKKLGVEIPE